MLTIEMAGQTDAGQVREHNEDAIAWSGEAGWAVLADGMGGHLAGEVASALAVETLGSALASAAAQADGEALLRAAVAEANHVIYSAAQAEQQRHNMGTTLLALRIDGERAHCVQIGDSRLYRSRGAALELLSHDHSLVQELIDEGFMSRDEAAGSVHRNVITRGLGLEATVEPAMIAIELVPGDLLLLCSDGLSDKLSEPELIRLLNAGPLEPQLTALVAAANNHGGEDNISAILVRVSNPTGNRG